MAKVSFDPVQSLIIINDGITELDAKIDIYSDWKEWVSEDKDNSKWPQAMRTVGGDPMAPGSYVGAYYFLMNGWRLRPSEADHQLIIDGNLFVDGGGNPFVPTLGPYTVLVTMTVSSVSTSLITDIPEIQYSSYNNGVTVDVLSSYSGTDYPVGTLQKPVNNIPDAVSIANTKGFERIYVHDSLTLTGNVEDFEFMGHSPSKTSITIEDAAETVNCEFKECTIGGTLDGNSVLEHCEVNTLNYVNGEIRNSRLAGPITLGGAANSLFLNCGCINPSIPPVIDMGGSGQDCIFHDYSGYLKFQNLTGSGNQIRVQIDGGKIMLMPSVSAGSITVVGIGLLVDSTGEPLLTGPWNGTTILNALVNVDTVADATWEQTQELKYRIESLRNSHVAFGDTFYWNPGTGDDLNDGETCATAVKTFTRAHDLVTSEHGDIITIVGGTDFIVTEHIVVTKHDVHVRGQGPGTQVKVPSGAAINISGKHCSAEAIKSDGGDTGVIITGAGFSGTDLTVVNAVGNGVEITSVGSKLESVYCSDCGGNGVEVKDGTIGLRIKECGIRNNVNGINVNTGVIGLVLSKATNVSSNSNYGVNINAGAVGTIIYDGTIVHGNTVGDINDNGIATTVRGTDEAISDSVWSEALSQYTSPGTAAEILNKIKQLAALIPAGL